MKRTITRLALVTLSALPLFALASPALALSERFQISRDGIINRLSDRFEEEYKDNLNSLSPRFQESREQRLNALSPRFKESWMRGLDEHHALNSRFRSAYLENLNT
jgi:hypothetical protein